MRTSAHVGNNQIQIDANNEIRFITLCQKIKDEIARLENLRDDWNYTVNTAEAKLTILNRLLQLITVPEVFTDFLSGYYFEGKQSISVGDLIKKLMNDEQFRDTHSAGKPKVKNIKILNSGIDDVSAYQSNLVQSLEALFKEFGDIEIKRNPKKQQPNYIPEINKTVIDEIDVFGDSLTDINLMRNSAVGDYCGLKGNSPKGSFTNGYTWLGHLYNYLFNRSVIPAIENHLKSTGKSHTDDDIDNYLKNKEKIKKYFELKNEGQSNVLTINGKVVSRSYAIGGATADSYKWLPSTSITRYFTRLMVSRLEDQRNKFLADEAGATDQEKRNKLIIEWTGANDLITVNEVPSLLEADNAVKARMAHLEELIKNGYANFVLCNLPDLSLTPRYKNKSIEEQANARACTDHFNRQLEAGVAELKKLYPQCNIDVCDVNSKFKAGIEGILKGGTHAEPYKKFIDTEYRFQQYVKLPEHIDRNAFYLQFDHSNNLTYSVIDPCGRKRTGIISFNDLVLNYDKSLPIKDSQQAAHNEIIQYIKTNKLEKNSKLRQCILAITTDRGDTLAEDDFYTPLKDTKAFARFEKELSELNPPKTIEDIGYLPGVNRLFFDDVHPSADMQRFLYKEIKGFIESKYHINTPEIDLKKNPKAPNRSKDDMDIPKEKPVMTKPWANLGLGHHPTEKELVVVFLREYHHQFNLERGRYFGWLRERNLQWTNSNITLDDIVKHAAESTTISKNRTYKILQKMEWIKEEEGSIKYSGPDFEKVMHFEDLLKIK